MSGIDPGYRHAPKHVTQGEPIEPDGAVLKWYAVHPADRPVPDELTRLARTFLMKTSLEARGLGFVLLHRGKDFYFLIACTWRNSNELWETVFYKNEDAMADFAPFPRDGEHKATLCVWELVPVWHEHRRTATKSSCGGRLQPALCWLKPAPTRRRNPRSPSTHGRTSGDRAMAFATAKGNSKFEILHSLLNSFLIRTSFGDCRVVVIERPDSLNATVTSFLAVS